MLLKLVLSRVSKRMAQSEGNCVKVWRTEDLALHRAVLCSYLIPSPGRCDSCMGLLYGGHESMLLWFGCSRGVSPVYIVTFLSHYLVESREVVVCTRQAGQQSVLTIFAMHILSSLNPCTKSSIFIARFSALPGLKGVLCCH